MAWPKRPAAEKTRTVLKGQIVSNNQPSLIEWTVRDLSDTGAKICFVDPCELPSEFELEIPS